mgnify:CR=1 FL=1
MKPIILEGDELDYWKEHSQLIKDLSEWEEDGKWEHERTIAPYYGTISPTKIQTIITKPFWVRVEPHKHRYIYILGKDKKDKKELLKNIKHPLYPYPKTMKEYKEEIIKLEPIESRK